MKLVLTTAHGLATLLQHGANISDGDTIGVSMNERIPVHVIESRRFGGLPVIAAKLNSDCMRHCDASSGGDDS